MQRNSKIPHSPGRLGPIVLVGMMGVGKSTVGRRLAARLGLAFVDADEEIEKAAGMSVAEIFDRYGEAYFRDGERRVIARLMDGAPKVIATGGGAFMQEETRRLILDAAIAVWLDADIDILVDRVGRRDSRPLLKNRDPRAVLTELAALRNPIYALAPIHVKSIAAPHEVAVDRIMEQLTAQQFLVSVSPRITRVAPLTLLDVKQNFAMRKMLQPEIFAMAASQVDADLIARMNEDTSHKAPLDDDEIALKLLKANKQFNVYMAQHVKSPLLIHWIRQLAGRA